MKNDYRIFKTKSFYRWQRKELIPDKKLHQAILEIDQGLVDAELGSGLIKKRIAKPGFGKSSSYRTIIATNRNDKWFFIYGFSKNEQENITGKEFESIKHYSSFLLEINNTEITAMLKQEKLLEISDVY